MYILMPTRDSNLYIKSLKMRENATNAAINGPHKAMHTCGIWVSDGILKI